MPETAGIGRRHTVHSFRMQSKITRMAAVAQYRPDDLGETFRRHRTAECICIELLME
jgi:hypothetical protein